MKFGVDVRRLVLRQTGGAFINYLLFPTAIDSFSSTGKVSLIISPDIRPAKIEFNSFSTFAQDTWRLGQRAALSGGFRREVNPSPKGLDGTLLASWLNTDSPAALALAPSGTAPWRTTYSNIAPRIGLAYRATSQGDLVVRGGWGVFYDLGTGTAPALGASLPNSNTIRLLPPAGPYPVPIDPSLITPLFSSNPPYPVIS